MPRKQAYIGHRFRLALAPALLLAALEKTPARAQTYELLHTFQPVPGQYPSAGLIADSSGNLYGTTYQGGVGAVGTAFKLDASNGYALTTLHSFALLVDGGYPQATLLADSAGNLYGNAEGGSQSCGTVYKLDASNGYALTTLHTFTCSDGAHPYGALIADSSGNLYGTTQLGGGLGPCNPYGCGTVFKLDASRNYALTTLHSFAYSDGGYPQGALIADSAGNIYGTTNLGGLFRYGTVFKLDASNGYALTTLQDFNFSDGANSYAALIADSTGNLYGTTYFGGPLGYAYGTVFKLDASNNYALTTLHFFIGGTDGANPPSGLIGDSAGNLYGTTQADGASLYGTVFKLDASHGYALTTLHAFTGGSDGGFPAAALIADSAGNLYGTTAYGGAAGYGAVFSLDAASNYALTTLHSFDYSDGGNPIASLIADSSDNVYGTTSYGGTGGNGVVFSVNLACWPSTPAITAPSSAVVGATGILAGVTNHSGSTYNWALSGGTITAGQGSSSILLDAGLAGTTMMLSVVETFSTGCSSGVGTKNIQVDFLDVPPSDSFHDFIDTIAANGITAGCGGGNYCPGNSVTRAQMAVFLLKGEHGSGYLPPLCTGIFADVECTPVPAFAVSWIEQLSRERITAGCGRGNYCPNDPVTRAQIAVFLLKAEHGPAYTPPACTSPGIFGDVTCPGGFAVDWIEQLSAEGITGGCGGGNYCPDSPNTRGQMAVFLVKTFNLP